MTAVVPMQRSGTVVDARMSLAMWLRAGRSQRNLSLEDVARITKIQVRILERLEAGTIKPGDGMPADVFVRGFVRSIAKCVGLDETEALRRYTEAAAQAALDLSPVTAGPSARAFVDSMSELAPTVSGPVSALAARAPSLAAGSLQDLPAIEIMGEPTIDVEPAIEVVVETAPAEMSIEIIGEQTATDGKKKKSSKKGTGKGRKRRAIANGTPFEPTPVVAQSFETATAVDPIELAEPQVIETLATEIVVEPIVATTDASVGVAIEVVEPGEIWAPKMPIVVAPTVPWRINASAQSLARSKASTARIVPSIVIDDAAPDLAEREIEDRASSRSMDPAVGRSFLPKILRDREDRSARQGGLTLAVIILLIAATLTLSYLMRRPSSSGDGVTQADLVESVDQLA